jgi:hypothetical protein
MERIRKENAMRKVTSSSLYWIGVVCILIGFALGVLTATNVIALSKTSEVIAIAFSVGGGILVIISYYQSRRAA